MFDRYRDAGLGGRLASELERRLKQRKRRRQGAVRKAAAAAILAVAIFWGVPYFKETGMVSASASTLEDLALADGSHAELNANSELATDFRYGRRIVKLTRGEGFFSVAHDPAHPFLVETPGGTVRVVGTKFNVRLDAQLHPEVTLVEGRVLFAADRADGVALHPGEQLKIENGQPAIHPLTTRAMEQVLAWRRGLIVLDGMPLGEAAAGFARFHGCLIAVDPAVAGLRLGGTYSLKNLPLFLDSLRATGAVKISSENGVYHLRAN
ncbi:MAG: anti-FecI sigma factor, FecR [Verrucomicrobia bacterium]|nr:anti-FecI sigma factor, FecR [Verrucomicrobiota bacterium]